MKSTYRIYKDWEQETILLGVAEILEKLEDGYTFILQDMPESQQIVYSGNKYRVRFIGLTTSGLEYVENRDNYITRIREIYNIGVTNSNYIHDNRSAKELQEDKFIVINGIEIF